MSCAVLTNAPKQKEDLLNAPNTPMWFIKIKYESKTIMKYTEDDIVEHPYGVIKRQWGFYYYDQENH
jgi:hypothetical protein